MIKEYEEASVKLGSVSDGEEKDKLAAKMDELQNAIDAKNGWWVWLW